MSYVMIQNKGELPLWGMRLLGFSDKDESKIGRFGTGLKEAIVLCGRLGNFPTIFSGTCRMDFEVQSMEGEIEEVCFRLSEQRGKFAPGEWHGLGLHPSFGHHDWNDPWMVLRETFCNAIDASGVEDLHHDVFSGEPTGVAGSTRVFIPTSPTVLEAYGRTCSRLLAVEPREELWSDVLAGRALVKSSVQQGSVFHKGVWVGDYCKSSCFDYELDRVKLTESRTTDLHTVHYEIANLLKVAPTECATAVLAALKGLSGDDTLLELTAIMSSVYIKPDAENGAGWVEAFRRMYGDRAAMCQNERNEVERLMERGYQPVLMQNSQMFDWLKSAGVPHFRSIVTEAVEHLGEVMEPTETAQSQFDEVWEGMRRFAGDKKKPALKVFTSDADNVTGLSHEGTCYIHVSLIGSLKARQVHIEEIAHYISEAGDGTRKFQDFLIAALEERIR